MTAVSSSWSCKAALLCLHMEHHCCYTEGWTWTCKFWCHSLICVFFCVWVFKSASEPAVPLRILPCLSSLYLRSMGGGGTLLICSNPKLKSTGRHRWWFLNGSSNVTLCGLVKYAAKKGTQEAFIFVLCVQWWRAKTSELSGTMPAALQLQTMHWLIPTAVNVLALSINSQPAYFSPKVAEKICEHANPHRTGLSLSLSCYAKSRSRRLSAQSHWITTVERPIYASRIHSLWR